MIQFPLPKEVESNVLSLSEEQRKVVEDYYRLALLENLSEDEQERMVEILENAQIDTLIEFWINEIDHIVGHKLNLIDDKMCRNEQALVKEHIVFPCESPDE